MEGSGSWDKFLYEEDLDGLMHIVAVHNGVFSRDAAAAMLRVYRGRPVPELVVLCTLGTEPSEARFAHLQQSLMVFMKADIKSSLSDREKLSSEKLLRGTIKRWGHDMPASFLTRQGQANIAKFPVLTGVGQLTAEELSALTFSLLLTGVSGLCGHPEVAKCVLLAVSRGFAPWLEYTSDPAEFRSLLLSAGLYEVVSKVGSVCCQVLGSPDSLRILLQRPESGAEGGNNSASSSAADLTLLYSLVEAVLPPLPALSEAGDLMSWLSISTAWPGIASWTLEEQTKNKTKSSSGVGGSTPGCFAVLEKLASQICEAVEEAVTSLEDGSITAAMLKTLEHEAHSIHPLLVQLGLQEAFLEALKQKCAELRELEADFSALRSAYSRRRALNNYVFQIELS